MKREQALTTIVLGVTAMAAVIALLILFTKTGSATHFAIGDAYPSGQQDRGIGETYPLPKYVRYDGYGRPMGPAPELPAPTAGIETIGTRTPAMIFFRGEHAGIEDMSKCWSDLAWQMAAPKDALSCYVVPTTGGHVQEVTGWFPPSSAARPRLPAGYEGRLGGDVYCYTNTAIERNSLVERLTKPLQLEGWQLGTVNGQDVLMCLKGAFPFPQ